MLLRARLDRHLNAYKRTMGGGLTYHVQVMTQVIEAASTPFPKAVLRILVISRLSRGTRDMVVLMRCVDEAEYASACCLRQKYTHAYLRSANVWLVVLEKRTR